MSAIPETITVRVPKPCELEVQVREEKGVWLYGYRLQAPATPEVKTNIYLGGSTSRAVAIDAGLERVERVLLDFAKKTGPAEQERLEKMAACAAKLRRDFATQNGASPAAAPPAPAKKPAKTSPLEAARLAGAAPTAVESLAPTKLSPPVVAVPPPPVVLVDPEFDALCPRQTPEEESLLESSLATEGCRDAITIWQETGLVLDGHTRLRKCRELRIEFATRGLSFPDRNAALNWIIANQLGRRNLSDEQKSYLRGKRYQAEKQAVGAGLTAGPKARKSSSGNDCHSKTADKLAAEYGVAEKTIRSDADFAAGVDEIAKTEGPEARAEILSGKSKRTKREVIAKVKPSLTASPEGRPSKPKDPRLNACGVFVKGLETIKIKTPAGTKAVIDLVEAAPGDWRYGYDSGCRAGSSSGPAKITGKACSSRERAIEAAARSMLHWAGIHGKSAGSARESQLAAALHKAIEKFIRDQVAKRRDVEMVAEAGNPAAGVQVPPWAADLRAETVARLHQLMDAAAGQVLKFARKAQGKSQPLTPASIEAAAGFVFTPGGGVLPAILRVGKSKSQPAAKVKAK